MTYLGDGQANWDVIDSDVIVEHPFVTLSMETVRLPDGRTVVDWPKIYTNDYVNAVVLNGEQEVLIIEGYKHGTGRVCWQIVGGYIETGEDPFSAVQRELLEETGYGTHDWSYLGTYIVDPNRHVGVGHLFCAQNVSLMSAPQHDDLEAFTVKWVPLKEVRYALLDGRLSTLSHATTVALALLTILK